MRRAVPLAAFALLALTLCLLAHRPGTEESAAAEPPAIPHYVPELGLPATEVVAFGASPGEAPTEAWAYGYLGDVPPAGAPGQTDRYALLERAPDGTWQPIPLPTGAAGQVATKPDPFLSKLGALAGQSTPAGSVALLTGPGIVLKDPRPGAPRLLPAPSGAELLGAGETIPPSATPEGAPTPYAVYDPAPGKAGLLIAPYGDGAAGATPGPGVLDYDGTEWRREPIEAGGEPVAPQAIACGPTASAPTADSGEDCWLLATVGGKLGLFRRGPAPSGGTGAGGEGSATMSWAPVRVEGGLLGGGSAASLAPLTGNAQMLTATSQGVWVDFAATIGGEAARSASELVEPTGSGAGGPTAKVSGSWCFPTGTGCEDPLGAAFPAAYRSFAWPGTSATDPGRRIITGFADRTTLELTTGGFAVRPGPGGSPGVAPGGAAFAAPELGFVADGVDPDSAPDGAGQSQMFDLTVEPQAPQTATEPVPFRRPLTAIAMNPDGSGEALGVGAGGEFAHFDPRLGWSQDTAQVENTEGGPDAGAKGDLEETLLGVSWPTPERAYAVGGEGGLWIWSSVDATWQPLLSKSANSWSAVAFSPSEPSLGYIVGSLGILGVRKSTQIFFEGWEPDAGPSETPAVFTSIAYAGAEAIATWHTHNTETGLDRGGISVGNGTGDGSGFKIEPEVEELIDALPGPARWPTKVAGLPDGGAVLAGPGFVLKRESARAKWQFSAQPLPEAGNIAALGAYRDPGGAIRAVVSIDLGPRGETTPNNNGASEEPLPSSGYLLRETADGWNDVEHAALPVKAGSPDMPLRPEPTLGLAVSADGKSILGVGGQTGTFGSSAEPTETEYETGAAIRSPASAAVDPDTAAPPAAPLPGAATFAFGGNAACAAPCAAGAADGFGPDATLSHALAKAKQLSANPNGPRAFVYTGGRLESGAGESGYEAELARLASIFGGSPSTVLTVPSPDLTAGGESLFASAFSGYGPQAGSTSYYSVRSEPPGEAAVDVIVIDLSSGELGSVQEAWLRKELAAAVAANLPVVVVGNASLGFTLPDPPVGVQPPTQVKDPKGLSQILNEGHAAVYFFDYPGANVFDPTGAAGILAVGTGTLGYGKPAPGSEDWLGSNSLIFGELLPAPSQNQSGSIVAIRAVPDIESLTMHGRGVGTRLEAGEAELFEGLGRIAAGGIRLDGSAGSTSFDGPEPYVTLPFPSKTLQCHGPNCAYFLGAEFGFSSSEPAVGDFITTSGEVELNGQPLSNPISGFFCAKKPGSTTISITAGGLSYSTLVEVTAPAGAEAEAGGCQGLTVVGPTETESAAPAPAQAQPPTPSTPPAPGPAPTPHGGVTPSPTPTHHPAPNPAPPSPAPTPPAPVATPAPVGPAPPVTNPVVAPHSPPGPQPAPPTGVSTAAQPVTQGAPGAQVANAPAPGTVTAPAAAPGQEREEQAAIQREHMAVRSTVRPTASPSEYGAMQAGRGSGSIPLAALLLGPAALIGLASAIGASASARGRRRSYAKLGRRF